MVYRVISTEFLPLQSRQIRDPDEDRFLGLLKTFIKSGPMYFSYSVDLTNSFQRQSQQDLSAPMWMRADDRFFWNRYAQSSLIDFRNKGARGQPGAQPGVDPFILPIIFGMLEIHPTTFKSTSLTLALITRRSRFRGGTRYFSRGIDEDGHVSNYNETEQIVVLNDGGSGMGGFAGSSDMQSGKLGGSNGREAQIMSYVQTRGSVPVLWSEINNLKYTPKVAIRSIDSALPAAARHFAEQIQIYGDNYLVNLVNQKGRERPVKEAYEEMVRQLMTAPRERVHADNITSEKFHTIETKAREQSFDRLHYVYFDFHSETKGMQMHRAALLLERLGDALVAQQYFRAVDMPASPDGRLEVRNSQTSVVRTNCMDCLDRTNVVQSMLARYTLDRIFVDLGLMAKGATFKEEDPAFEHMFRNLWADNADVVSMSYAGTGAMKTDLTRLGYRTKAGTLRDGEVGVTRYMKNNFLDGPRQDAFDLFLGYYSPASAGSSLVFVDRRPVLIQAIPYLLAFSIFFVFVGLFTKRLPDSAVLPMRIFLLFWSAVAAWSLHFIFSNGMLYVCIYRFPISVDSPN
jgi:phosphatidylinositol 4-phosphatase